MAALANDLRQALRILRSKPGFTIMAVLMLALGIGSCTAIFTVVNAVLLRPLPYAEPGSLVQLWEVSVKGGHMNVPEANFADWKSASHSFENMAMFNSNIQSLLVGSDPIRARIATVSGGFFDTIGTKPFIGRTLPSQPQGDSQPIAVVSYGFWKRALGGNPSLTGMQLTYSGKTLSVVGVMPPEFNFPAGAEIWDQREIWDPVNPSRSAHNWSVIARLRNGANASVASHELGAIAKDIHARYHDVTAVDAVAIPLIDQMTQSVSGALTILLAAVMILLLVACANVTNLLLSHIAAREREIAVRTALGASRGAIARLFLVQSLTLTLIGGALGLVLSEFGVNALLAMSDGTLPRMDEIRADGWVLAFAIAVSISVGLVLGLLPALRAGRMNLDATLKQGGRAQNHGTASRAVRGILVVAQVAMTVVLLVGAGLLGRSFVQVLQVSLGFATENRIAVDMLTTQENGTEGRQRLANQIEQLRQQIAALPGVLNAGGINQIPLSGRDSNGRFLIEGGKDSGAFWPGYRTVTAGYFETMGIPLIRGRLFDQTDGWSTPEVAIVSQAVANGVWPGEDVIGKRINTGNMDGDRTFTTIVGVVGDVRNSPEAAASGEIYVNSLQRGYVGNYTLVVRSAAVGTQTLGSTITTLIRSANPETSARVQTLDRMFASNLANRRFNFALIGVFGGTAMILALMGIYGLTSYSVAQRTQEIGIRVALGAQHSDVVRLFLGEGSRLVLLGIVIGIVGAVAASRVLSAFLFNVQTTDVTTYLLAIVPMFAAAMLASHLPARRAARVDPLITIRDKG